jgi:hypothetical protein
MFASGLPPVAGGEPTPVKRVSSSAPRPAANRVLSSLVPRSSLMSAIHVPAADIVTSATAARAD